MLRSDLIDRLIQRNPHLSSATVDQAVKMLLEHMTETLMADGRIEIRGFGSFNVRKRPARLARNPKTGKLEPLPGLVARRAKEAALYLTADTEYERTGSAQAVAPEPPLMSKIEGVAGAAAAVAPVGQFLAGMDWKIAAIIAVVALSGIGAMVWTRFNERGA